MHMAPAAFALRASASRSHTALPHALALRASAASAPPRSSHLGAHGQYCQERGQYGEAPPRGGGRRYCCNAIGEAMRNAEIVKTAEGKNSFE